MGNGPQLLGLRRVVTFELLGQVSHFTSEVSPERRDLDFNLVDDLEIVAVESDDFALRARQ